MLLWFVLFVMLDSRTDPSDRTSVPTLVSDGSSSVSMGYVGLTIDTDSHVVREVVSSVSAVTVMS